MCKVQPVEQPKGAPFWSPILLTMSMTVATTPTMAITIVTGMSAFMDVASKVVCLVKWMKIKPGPRDRGPLTLLGYLRHAILEMGGFPGFYGNAAFEPLRRELVGGLEPF